jgi:hypothetical protein
VTDDDARIDRIERDITILMPLIAEVATLHANSTNQARAVEHLSDAVESLKKAIVGAALVVATTSIGGVITTALLVVR